MPALGRKSFIMEISLKWSFGLESSHNQSSLEKTPLSAFTLEENANKLSKPGVVCGVSYAGGFAVKLKRIALEYHLVISGL